MEQWIDLILKVFIAGVASYIALQQWKTNQQKLKWDMYDRRLRIYEEVKKILSITARDAKASDDDLLNFRRSVSEADFLFYDEPEIPKYLDEIYEHGLNLARASIEYQEKPEGYDPKEVVDVKSNEISWFLAQFESAKQKFKKYLVISK